MMNKKVMILTGVTGNIGEAILAESISEYFVIGIGRNEQKGERLKNKYREFGFAFLAGDIKNERFIEEIFELTVIKEYGIDIFVHAAGVISLGATVMYKFEELQEVINVNLISTISMISKCLQIMEKRNEGKIILIGSRWGRYGSSIASLYSATKSALTAFVKSIQAEYLHKGIRISLISPGSVESEMSNKVNNKIKEQLIETTDVAKVIKFIISTPNYISFDEIVFRAVPYDFYNWQNDKGKVYNHG